MSHMEAAADTLRPPGPALYLVAGRGVNDDTSDDFIGATEAGRLLGLHRGSVWAIPADELPYTLTRGGGVRRQRRYRRADVERYRETHGRPVPPSTGERLDALESDMARVKRHLGLDDDGG